MNKNEESDNLLHKKKNLAQIIKKIIKLAIPSIISNLIIYSFETTNLIYVSNVENPTKYSKMELINSIGLGNIFMTLGGYQFGLGLINALETLCSHSFAKGDFFQMSRWVAVCNFFMTVYCLILATVFLFSMNILSFLGQPETIIKLTYVYLVVLIPSYYFQYYSDSFTKLLYAQQIYQPTLYINITCLLLHPFWCFIFYSYFKLGILGIGIAYDITCLLLLILTYSYTKYKNLYSICNFNCQELKTFSKTAIITGLLSSIETIGFEILSLISTTLIMSEFNSHISALNIYYNIYSISTGFGTTLTTLVGNSIGKQNKLRRYIKLGILINLVLTITISAFMLIFDRYIALIYIDDTEILEITIKLIRLLAIFIIFDALHIQLSSVLRGLGKQKVGLIVEFIVTVIIQSTICYALMLYLGVYGIWTGMIICAIIVSIIFLIIIYF